MSDFNETYADAINSNSEERTSSMSDYSTSTTPNETRYQENTPTVTPEIVDAGTDVDLVETNPVAALAGNFQDDELTAHPLAPGETNYTEQEALQTTEDLKVKLLHALEAQYDFTHAAERAFDGHIWVALGYPEGMKGWAAYCRNNFSQQASIMRQLPKSDRRQLLLEAKSAGFSDRTVDQIFDVSASTIRRATADDGKQTGEDQ